MFSFKNLTYFTLNLYLLYNIYIFVSFPYLFFHNKPFRKNPWWLSGLKILIERVLTMKDRTIIYSSSRNWKLFLTLFFKSVSMTVEDSYDERIQ